MNNLNDVKHIIDEYYTKTGAYMEKAEASRAWPPIHYFKEAEKKFSAGLAELNKLKLSKEDRQHFKLLRDSFQTVIKACQDGAKGRYDKSSQLALESGKLLMQYKEVRSGG